MAAVVALRHQHPSGHESYKHVSDRRQCGEQAIGVEFHEHSVYPVAIHVRFAKHHAVYGRNDVSFGEFITMADDQHHGVDNQNGRSDGREALCAAGKRQEGCDAIGNGEAREYALNPYLVKPERGLHEV